MTTIVGIRDLVRNIDMLQNYDYVDIEDKKTHEYKGLFLSPSYAKEFKEYLEQKSKKEKEDKLSRLKAYAGKGSIDEKYNHLSSKELKESVSLEKLNG
ncbi:MAG: hypothetical protein M0P91_07815 [Sulfuricurvum sp.]|jgi:guanylate kinase|uniref:hypothetical protein n=1 Tax=Sulfuricurvum sp. TaxID=2025608 RepID=UPI0025D294DE|nr:hypothetical protein [Sulfuricurvum sp.]MCK9373090.1 hypothetical protein [Sulfuricurvum sp.]